MGEEICNEFEKEQGEVYERVWSREVKGEIM